MGGDGKPRQGFPFAALSYRVSSGEIRVAGIAGESQHAPLYSLLKENGNDLRVTEPRKDGR